LAEEDDRSMSCFDIDNDDDDTNDEYDEQELLVEINVIPGFYAKTKYSSYA
jgi:hypothetical protein